VQLLQWLLCAHLTALAMHCKRILALKRIIILQKALPMEFSVHLPSRGVVARILSATTVHYIPKKNAADIVQHLPNYNCSSVGSRLR